MFFRGVIKMENELKVQESKYTLFCRYCGWRLADPDPCEGCKYGEFFTEVNHQYDNEI